MKKFIGRFIITFIKILVESAIGVLIGWLLVFVVSAIFGRIDS